VPRIVCGVSLGAHVAVALARRVHPDLLALCLPAAIDGPASPPTRTDPTHQAAASAAGFGAERQGSATDWVGREVTRAWGLLTDVDLREALTRGAASLGPTLADLASLTCATVVAAWQDDPLHPLTVAAHWQSAIPRSRLVVVDRADAESDPYLLARAISGSR
jgi:pimeloyl-ACP methyl ester carboxylesterase